MRWTDLSGLGLAALGYSGKSHIKGGGSVPLHGSCYCLAARELQQVSYKPCIRQKKYLAVDAVTSPFLHQCPHFLKVNSIYVVLSLAWSFRYQWSFTPMRLLKTVLTSNNATKKFACCRITKSIFALDVLINHVDPVQVLTCVPG